MPKASPIPKWEGEDAFIIGGGRSLLGFDWPQLEDENTIGCNHAFIHGFPICKVCVFGDFGFWESSKGELESYDGWVVTNYRTMNPPPWLHFYPRMDDGLGTDKLAWNSNTGSVAVNLALIMGAKRVFLLGFDMHRKNQNKPHWHDKTIERPTDSMADEIYARFMQGFEIINAALPEVFPGREIINITDGSSLLKTFPCRTFDSVFGSVGSGVEK